MEKVLLALENYSKDFPNEANILFIGHKLYVEIMDIQAVWFHTFVQHNRTLLGCELVVIHKDDFELLTSSHEQMQLISKRHVGTTDDIQLMKLPNSWETEMDYSKPDTVPLHPEYITMPFYLLESYRKQFQPTQKQYARRGFTREY
ncbi:TPA: hypothetical protein JIR97_15560 [Acinetobacter baumannii]|uniref:hypothetical protein n=1 Tax=Acinetobacter baumannii TaxID=470 RepID=UPI002974CAE5|nr:hypothetical protein [Acinetobacter baumannii]HAV4536107.1 hypothetical protein [Acinetobacter baumannii]HEN9527423.1 hypothetical protein [Acinetobacter baumannii]HEN9555438.1 hypothetical protein [Acinetobacter baumannii]